jgi:hypothetical protein
MERLRDGIATFFWLLVGLAVCIVGLLAMLLLAEITTFGHLV